MPPKLIVKDSKTLSSAPALRAAARGGSDPPPLARPPLDEMAQARLSLSGGEELRPTTAAAWPRRTPPQGIPWLPLELLRHIAAPRVRVASSCRSTARAPPGRRSEVPAGDARHTSVFRVLWAGPAAGRPRGSNSRPERSWRKDDTLRHSFRQCLDNLLARVTAAPQTRRRPPWPRQGSAHSSCGLERGSTGRAPTRQSGDELGRVGRSARRLSNRKDTE